MNVLVSEIAMAGRNLEQHLDAAEVATYVDGTVMDDVRSALEAHIAACADCRAEILEVSRIVRTLRRHSTWPHIWVPAAAAAAIVLLLAWPRPTSPPAVEPHREAPIAATVSLHALAPVGVIDSLTVLVWSSVPLADRYYVRLFDADGTLLWERETSDTTVLPASGVPLRTQRSYYWKVEASTGFNRRVASELVEFTVLRPWAP